MKTQKAQHTPAPWSATNEPSGNVVVWANDRTANNGWEIAVPFGPDKQANARLIAAAPELLEALELLVNQADACAEFCKTFKADSRHHARQAIAKAKA